MKKTTSVDFIEEISFIKLKIIYFTLVVTFIAVVSRCSTVSSGNGTQSKILIDNLGESSDFSVIVSSLVQTSINDSFTSEKGKSSMDTSSSSNNNTVSSNSISIKPTITKVPTTKPQVTSATSSQVPTNIVFNDSVLENLIRQCTNKPTGNVTIKDWDALGYSAIYIRTTRIDNNTVIELIESQKSDLFKSVSGQISNLSALCQLPNVKNLSIIYMKEVPGASNIKFDMYQIKGLKNLEYLAFFMTITKNQPITHKFDFSNFNSITNLKTLNYLRINSAINVDVNVLSGMKNIKTLELVDCVK